MNETDKQKDLKLVLALLEEEQSRMMLTERIKDLNTDMSTRSYDQYSQEVKDKWRSIKRSISDTQVAIRQQDKINYEEVKENSFGTSVGHESYGSIVLSNPRGQANLFGSSIQHQHYVSMEICRAELCRSLHNDRIHPRESLIRIDMSHEQWGRFISGSGRGEGTPCTIRRFEHRLIKSPPFINKRAEFKNEFADVMKKLADRLRQLEDGAVETLQAKGTINKGDREKIANQINMLIQEVRSNIPYTVDLFDEAMENITEAAKTEVETFMQNIAQSTGINQLASTEGVKELISASGKLLNLDNEKLKSED